jgi:DNA-binding CsgD family transcriptional regulator
VAGRRIATNLFANTATCLYCKSRVVYRSYANRKTLVCENVLTDFSNCARFAWSYTDFEATFFDFIKTHRVDPDLLRLINAFESAMLQGSEREIFACRVDLFLLLSEKISNLSIATAGENPAAGAADGPVRTDSPNRYFEFQLQDGTKYTAAPASPENRGAAVDRLLLANVLPLSPRQIDLTSLLVEGLSLAETAQRLGITRETARWHLRQIFAKTHTHSQADLISLAQRRLLPEHPPR